MTKLIRSLGNGGRDQWAKYSEPAVGRAPQLGLREPAAVCIANRGARRRPAQTASHIVVDIACVLSHAIGVGAKATLDSGFTCIPQRDAIRGCEPTRSHALACVVARLRKVLM
jgi:hypothetical protein